MSQDDAPTLGATRAVNLRREPFDVYIGRAGRGFDGYFGNPYTLETHGPRALELFRAYFEKRVSSDPEFRERALTLSGKRLGCFCKPRPCHGDIISAWVNSNATEHRL